jgi:hypothetical protein
VTRYLTPGQEPVIAPGVRGCVIEHEGELHIPLVSAEHPGIGAVATFLESLPQDKRVVFPTVISEKLANMLLRRGFVERRQHGGFALETLRGGPEGVPVVYTSEPLTCFVREPAAAGFAALECAP